jgi:hypothetical protein
VAPEDDAAGVVELAERRVAAAAAAAGEGAGADVRGVAPAVQSFASGRRR